MRRDDRDALLGERVDLPGDGHDVLVVRQHDHRVGVARSTASRICAVDGFIDCPPATTCCTPRLVSKRRTPSPTATATTAVVDRLGCARPSTSATAGVAHPLFLLFDLLEQVGDADRCAAGPPRCRPRSRRRCRSVCTWQFQRPSPPTTTIESPSAPHASLNAGDRRRRARRAGTSPRSAARTTSSPREVRLDRRRRRHDLGLGDRAAVDDFEERVEQQREALRRPRRPRRRRGARAAARASAATAARGRRPRARARRPAWSPVARLSTASADLAHDGEDRALDRAHHRLVRGVGGAAQRRGQIVAGADARRARGRCRRSPAGSARGSRPSCRGRP